MAGPNGCFDQVGGAAASRARRPRCGGTAGVRKRPAGPRRKHERQHGDPASSGLITNISTRVPMASTPSITASSRPSAGAGGSARANGSRRPGRRRRAWRRTAWAGAAGGRTAGWSGRGRAGSERRSARSTARTRFPMRTRATTAKPPASAQRSCVSPLGDDVVDRDLHVPGRHQQQRLEDQRQQDHLHGPAAEIVGAAEQGRERQAPLPGGSA